MTWTDWKGPSANATIDQGANDWLNPDRAQVDSPGDDTSAASTGFLKSAGNTDTQRWTAFGFTTDDIPDGVTINGVEVRLDCAVSSGAANTINLVTEIFDATNGVSAPAATNLPQPRADITEGGATDLWGNASISDADVRASTFGVQLEALANPGESNVVGAVYFIEVRVDYSDDAPPSAAGSLESGTPTVVGSAAITGRVASGSLKSGGAAISGEAMRAIMAAGAAQAQLASLGGGSVEADTGFVIAGAGANDASYGDDDWNDPGNITADDGSAAQVTLFSETSNYLVSSSHGFAIPNGSTIAGIEVRVQAAKEGGALAFDRVRIVKGGTIGSTEGASSEAVPESPTNIDFGGAADLWGETWSAADINASNFGAAVTITGGPAAVQVDAIWIKVYYTEGGGPAQATVTRKAQGTPKAQAAAVVGSAAALKIHAAAGALVSGNAGLAGAAERTIKAAGTLSSGAASILGSASIIVQGLAIGALQAGAAAIEGAASRTVKAAGAVQSGAASAAGVATRTVKTVAAALASGAAKITGLILRGWHSEPSPGETWTAKSQGDDSTWYDDTPGGGETWR